MKGILRTPVGCGVLLTDQSVELIDAPTSFAQHCHLNAGKLCDIVEATAAGHCSEVAQVFHIAEIRSYEHRGQLGGFESMWR